MITIHFIKNKQSDIPINCILYTSTDSNIIVPSEDAFDVNVINNTYTNGIGIWELDAPVTTIYKLQNIQTLQSISFPNSITLFGYYVFSGCNNLNKITFRGSIEEWCNINFLENGPCYIGENLYFFNKKLENTIIPEGVSTIPAYAFNGCKSIISLHLPNTTEVLGWHSFGYIEIPSIVIPKNVRVADWAFFGAKITNVIWEAIECNDFQYVPSGRYALWPFSASLALIQNFIFGNEVLIIPWRLCENMSNITEITIPKSVKKIGDYAFRGCSSLRKVNCVDITQWCNILFGMLGSNPIELSHNLFINDIEIKDLAIPSNVTSIGNYAFSGFHSLTSVTIPNSVTSIGGGVFSDCSSLTSITIPESVTSIGNHAFSDCSGLTKTNYTGDIAGWCTIKFGGGSANPISNSHNLYINDQEIQDLVIPNSVTNIGDYAFYKCSSLNSVTISEGVTSIGEDAFYGCSSLTSATIGESVKSIGDYTFSDCSSLTSITCKAITPPTLGVSNHLSNVTAVYVPAESVDAYKTDARWSYYADKILPIQ